ncbi:MAG: STAS domain-containing protein [Planctomycetaceae bacterium]|nr:STAS domain-containing protein [Planctomycetaceae bacterium]MCA9045098.1 STAS domain-containing protein [Planctomycetaceae bacterium]
MNGFESNFFTCTESGDAVVLRLDLPQLTEEDNLEQLDEEFTALVDTFGVRKLVVNLERLNYLTSHAIGKLIGLHRRMQRVEGALVLCSAGDDVQQILQTAHLWTYFKMASSPSEAVTLLV